MSSGTFFGDIIRNPLSFNPRKDAKEKRAAKNAQRDQQRLESQQETPEQRAAAEQQAQEAQTKKAAAFLTDRNASGFGTNPNKARQFLLSF